MREIEIAGRRISDSDPCYVIAEIGHNHGGSVQTAQQMIRMAAAAGCDAVKFQKRSNRTLYSPDLYAMPYESEHSYGKTFGEHREALEFTRTEYTICQSEAHRVGVSCFATAFDEESADFLAALHVPAIKIASGGLTDLALLRHVAGLRIPVILSTGGGTIEDVDRAVGAVSAVHDQLAILHCVASYPVRDFAELNLRCIQTYRERYPEFVIGWSGHDSGIAMALMAYTLGARIVEKHFCLNRADRGSDQAFSLEPDGMRKMVRDLKRAHVAWGDGIKRWSLNEVGPIARMRRRMLADGTRRITGEKDVPPVN